ncbi:MAG: folate family ECF transporter S component [Clostridia bacterium]|uniref:Folate family ECF transporter S component n=1 Tax=Bianquea renquensis TaxID=2763661 RepID=A0A926DTE8_9FIRM|nr:folate family ECF transporter S component [Bianquea renquensis]MBC8543716.1 folate family ECF transporter S component [Bianquea renquensis]
MNKGSTFLRKFPDSFREMSKLRTITLIAMLLAVSVVLSFFTIQVSESLRLGLGYLITATMGMLFGPVTAGIAAGVGDIVKYLIKPSGAFFPGFTITAILGGVLYGMVFYHSRVTLVRAIVAKTLTNLLLNILLNTFWLSIMMGKGFWALVPSRVIKNIALLPVEILLLYSVLRIVTGIVGKLPSSPVRPIPTVQKK